MHSVNYEGPEPVSAIFAWYIIGLELIFVNGSFGL